MSSRNAGEAVDAARLLSLLQLLEQDAATGYSPTLQQLVQLFSQVQSTPNQNFYPQIEQAQQQLLTSLERSPVNNLVPTRRAMLAGVEGTELFGAQAATVIREIVSRGTVAGPAAVVAGLTEFNQRLQTFLANATKVRAGLEALGVKPAALGTGQFEFGIAVPEDVSKGHLENLTELLKDWNFVLKTFAELGGDRTPVVIVRGLATGSPFHFFASVPEWSAVAIAVAIERLAQFYKTILEIQHLRVQLQEKGVKGPEVDAVKQQEKEMLESSLDGLQKELLELAPSKDATGRKSELRNALSIALRQMAHYLDLGVDEEVSFPPPEAIPAPPATDDAAETARLQEQHQAAVGKRSDDALRGAAITHLPTRERPVFQLPKPTTPPDEEGGTKKGK